MDPPATKQQLQRQFQAEERAHQLHLRRSHHCFLGRLHLLSGMKLLIFIGMLAIIGILVLESLYFRKAIFVLLIPTLVTTSTVVAILKQSHQLVWPIIGISFFHMFLAMYALLIFSYYFFFKPLYIIMVLNWAFDTLHTNKTPSYYFHCFCIYAALILFFLFNLWQSRVSIGFRCFLEDDHQRQSLLRQFNQTAPSSTVSSVSSNFPPTQPPPPPPQMGNKGVGGYISSSKMLNEPPIVLISSNNNRGQQYMVGAADRTSRRSSLTESRRLAV